MTTLSSRFDLGSPYETRNVIYKSDEISDNWPARWKSMRLKFQEFRLCAKKKNGTKRKSYKKKCWGRKMRWKQLLNLHSFSCCCWPDCPFYFGFYFNIYLTIARCKIRSQERYVSLSRCILSSSLLLTSSPTLWHRYRGKIISDLELSWASVCVRRKWNDLLCTDSTIETEREKTMMKTRKTLKTSTFNSKSHPCLMFLGVNYRKHDKIPSSYVSEMEKKKLHSTSHEITS